MKRYLIAALCLLATSASRAQNFTEHFADKTLRIDYLFTGNASQQNVCIDELSVIPSWAGRRNNLSRLPLQGNGQICMKDAASGDVIYKTSFSSLFHEWLETDEAKTTSKGFENTFLLPFPLHPAEVEITLFNQRQEAITQLKHIINPSDVLIHQKGRTHISPHKYLLRNGDASKCIDVAILAEGYTQEEMDIFYQDANIACESIFSHEPFKSMKGSFNVVAVATASADSGVSIPRLNDWKHTSFNSHFSTFYSDRYLTTSRVKSIHDALAGIEYEHIIILANTDEYGGGGIYNAYTLTTAHHPMFRPVVVHEFGHSFGGLADEYYYDEDIMSDMYPLDIEPWEQNITTRIDFASKWEDMLPKSVPIPTPANKRGTTPIGVYEGGGYSAKGIFRPAHNCRMRTNEHPEFCLVCQRALRRVIEFYTK